MKKKIILDVFSVTLIASGILLIIWWTLLGISQVFSNSGDSLSQLVQSTTWIPINIIGLVASLFLVIGLMRILFEDESSLELLKELFEFVTDNNSLELFPSRDRRKLKIFNGNETYEEFHSKKCCYSKDLSNIIFSPIIEYI